MGTDSIMGMNEARDASTAAGAAEGLEREVGTGLVSILALCDLRMRMRRAQVARGDVPLVEFLALDPLTILRLLRMSHAPVNAKRTQPQSIEELVSQLGSIVVKRALDVPAFDPEGTSDIRELWMHSLACAEAAADLARAQGGIPAEQAYFLGLLHDLPAWVSCLSGIAPGPEQTGQAVALAEDWCLPRTVLAYHRQAAADLPPGCFALLQQAENLAHLAGYLHPEAQVGQDAGDLLAEASREDLIAAQNLRGRVIGRLAGLNMESTEHAPDGLQLRTSELNDSEDASHRQGDLADVVSTLQQCSSAYKYRGIITATTAATLRYLDYERAFMVTWSPKQQMLWIRAKSDLSPIPVQQFRLQPNAEESQLLESAYHMEKTVTLARRPGCRDGLLHTLGSDALLCVPMNVTFHMPSFLVLDRTLTGRPVCEDQDIKNARALAGTASILNENLLLKKRAQRSQRFALTDPLTRLFNRGVGMTTLDRELSRARRSEQPLTLMMLDLDEFKQLNDQHGHMRGDQALRLTAEVLRKTLRKQDTVCRYGGEEFMVVLPETTIEQASVIATRIFTAVESVGKAHSLPLTISVGLTQVLVEKDSVETVLNRADHALYASKERGRNRFSVDSVR